jgi:hypothetical protein
MEISEVRQRVLQTIDRAKRKAAERRSRADQAAVEYQLFHERIAVPLFRQVANALKAAGYNFTVFTPADSVRMMSDKTAEDYVELLLDTTGKQPAIVCHSSRARGRRVLESERVLGTGTVGDVTEHQVLEALLEELEPFVER